MIPTEEFMVLGAFDPTLDGRRIDSGPVFLVAVFPVSAEKKIVCSDHDTIPQPPQSRWVEKYPGRRRGQFYKYNGHIVCGWMNVYGDSGFTDRLEGPTEGQPFTLMINSEPVIPVDFYVRPGYYDYPELSRHGHILWHDKQIIKIRAFERFAELD